MIDLRLGDCLEVMRTLPDCSVDAVVTDPPYGLSFMGKAWDYDVPQAEVWREVLRVLKPGGHLLSFFGSRTYHRGVVQIEDAGFEIRDQIMWVYGSGFPKSLDVSKAIDKAAGAERTMRVNQRWADRYPNGPGGNLNAGDDGQQYGQLNRVSGNPLLTSDPVSPEARQWAGWGTALKPSHEPIVVARKPLIGTVAENVLAYGTGGINVDGCRVGTEKNVPASPAKDRIGQIAKGDERGRTASSSGFDPAVGRWPANLIHDGSDEVVGLFPQTQISAGGGMKDLKKGRLFQGNTNKNITDQCSYGDTGSAARFFYCAKASRSDRGDGNTHPTVKPTDLMAYLCRLITPPGGVVLDPFMGSGSTGKAARREGFGFIGIERDPGYLEIARQRIGTDEPLMPEPVPASATATQGQLTLFAA